MRQKFVALWVGNWAAVAMAVQCSSPVRIRNPRSVTSIGRCFSSPIAVDKNGVFLELAHHAPRFLLGRCGNRAGEADSRQGVTDI